MVRRIATIAVPIAAATSPHLGLALPSERVALPLDFTTRDVSLRNNVDAKSAVRLGRLTTDNVGGFAHFAVDGRVIARTVIREPVFDGKLRITMLPEDVAKIENARARQRRRQHEGDHGVDRSQLRRSVT